MCRGGGSSDLRCFTAVVLLLGGVGRGGSVPTPPIIGMGGGGSAPARPILVGSAFAASEPAVSVPGSPPLVASVSTPPPLVGGAHVPISHVGGSHIQPAAILSPIVDDPASSRVGSELGTGCACDSDMEVVCAADGWSYVNPCMLKCVTGMSSLGYRLPQ